MNSLHFLSFDVIPLMWYPDGIFGNIFMSEMNGKKPIFPIRQIEKKDQNRVYNDDDGVIFLSSQMIF